MATSKDVAKLAGVSHTTVSRAFRGDSSLIKKETYDKIMRAAKELHYFPNYIAASLRRQRSKTIGFIISHVYVALFLDIARALEAELQKHGYRLLISYDGGDATRQHNAIQTMASAQVDSIVFMPVPYNEEQQRNEMTWMQASNIHFVQLITNTFKELSCFTFDDVHGTYVGMRHLFQYGHRRILMVGGANRAEGYYQAYHDIGEEPPFDFVDLDDVNPENTLKAIEEAILKCKPTAVFSIADRLNIVTFGVLTELRLKIREDISFLTFDDAFWLQALNISTIAHPYQAVAKAIVQQIIDDEEDEESIHFPSSIIFRPYLIERSSVVSVKEQVQKE